MTKVLVNYELIGSIALHNRIDINEGKKYF
jgi:hypothetical protein